jgi:acetylglutamate kinase
LALNARLLDFISNVPGVLFEGQVIPQLTLVQTEQLITDGVVFGGMIPKVRAALAAVASGVPQARIVNMAGLVTAGGTVFYQ